MPISDADRDAWNDAQRDGAPSIRILSDRTLTARQGHELDCGCLIITGERYRTICMMEDGRFVISKEHAHYLQCRLNGDAGAQARFEAEHSRRSEALGKAFQNGSSGEAE